jgi:hypothetical protein
MDTETERDEAAAAIAAVIAQVMQRFREEAAGEWTPAVAAQVAWCAHRSLARLDAGPIVRYLAPLVEQDVRVCLRLGCASVWW